MNEINKHADLIASYQDTFRQHGDTPAAVQWPRGRQALRFKALTKHFAAGHFSVIDYGCGLGHLKPFLDEHYDNVDYCGVDVVPEFIDTVRNKFPQAQAVLINNCTDLSQEFDHVVISGTFNVIEGGDRAAYLNEVKGELQHLFNLARKSLAVNFMTDQVNYVQDGALHVSPEEMMVYCREHFGRRLLLDCSYMPYEFSLVIMKQDEIIRPENIYSPL